MKRMSRCSRRFSATSSTDLPRSASSPVVDEHLVPDGAHVLEMGDVAGDDRQSVPERDGRDHYVGHADHAAVAFEVAVDSSSQTPSRIVQR
jgi:hypothetical protein